MFIKTYKQRKVYRIDMYFLNYLKEIENIKLDLKHIDKVYQLFSDIIKRSIDILIVLYKRVGKNN